MKKLILPLIVFFTLNACSTKDSAEIKPNNLSEKPVVEKPSSYWSFLGIYEGTDKEDHNQKLTYKIYLWQKEKKYVGYLYYLWYVNDSNYSENHARISGKDKKNITQLKGKFKDEPFVIEIKDSITSNIKMSIDFPTNYSQRINNFKLSKNKKESPMIAITTFPEDNMNLFIDSLMQIKMGHKGY